MRLVVDIVVHIFNLAGSKQPKRRTAFHDKSIIKCSFEIRGSYLLLKKKKVINVIFCPNVSCAIAVRNKPKFQILVPSDLLGAFIQNLLSFSTWDRW